MGQRQHTPLAVKVGIQAFAFTVGLIIFVLVDKATGWIGIF
jgi:hypothetical protein